MSGLPTHLCICACLGCTQVRDFVAQLGVENLGKRLVNSREGKVNFEKPKMDLATLMRFGRALVQEQVRLRYCLAIMSVSSRGCVLRISPAHGHMLAVT